MSNKIAVLGAGVWGAALAMVLARNGHEVVLWDTDQALLDSFFRLKKHPRFPEDVDLHANLQYSDNLADTIQSSKDIFIVVPSHAFEDVLTKIQPLVSETQSLAWATKGLSNAGEFLSVLARRILGNKRPLAILSGPSFAVEVARGLPTAVALAATDPQYGEALAKRFRNSTFAVALTDDIIGIQICAVVKNVLAVAVGISDGLQFGANARAALITAGLSEMRSLGKAMGAKPETFMGLAGCGDSILTCTDNQSRNRRFGLFLAEGLSEAEALKKVGQVVEAVYNVDQLYRLAQAQGVVLPITEQVFRIMKQGMPPREAITSLFSEAIGK